MTPNVSCERDVLTMGWKLELVQTFLLIEDDIMDQSQLRRGKPTWWTTVGSSMALNDGLILMGLGDVLMGAVSDPEVRAKLHREYERVQLGTALGQSLDAFGEASTDVGTEFTRDLYDDIVVLKTALYTFYDPLAVGIILARLEDEDLESTLLQQAHALSLQVGRFFQIQDDFLDCFGDPEVTGKVGTDIEDQKCSYLIVEALARAPNEEARRSLVAAYACRDKDAGAVQAIKDTYEAFGLRAVYEEEQTRFLDTFKTQLLQCHPALAVVFTEILFAIYKRSV